MQSLALLFALLATFPFARLAQLAQQQFVTLPILRRILMVQRILMHDCALIESDVRAVALVT